jgi:hypothetical protein
MLLPVQFAIPGGIAQNVEIVLYIVVAVVVIMFAGAARLSRIEEKQDEAGEVSLYPGIRTVAHTR